MKTWGNESINTLTTFDEKKGQMFDCKQRRYNWTGVECLS